MDALAFIDAKPPPGPQPVYVLAGEERFLKLQVLERIQQQVLGDGADDLARSVFDGKEVDLATVRDELFTVPFLSPCRLVIVQDADPFITEYREGLERYVSQPSSTGVLVLDVKSWKANTRLAKMLPGPGLITCSVPERNALPWMRSWLTKRAEAVHGKRLEADAATLLAELVGNEMGILDQELAKLAVYVGDARSIQSKDVDLLVGHSREESVWKILDAIAQGHKDKALIALHYLLDQGQEPLAILGAMSWQLRRLAQAARLREQNVPLSTAISRVGLYRQDQAEAMLRHLGPRALQLFDWLIETDLRMKSSGDLSPRTLLERLIVRLAAA